MIRYPMLAVVLFALSAPLGSATTVEFFLHNRPSLEEYTDVMAMENPLARETEWREDLVLETTQSVGVDPLDAWPGFPAMLKLALGESLPSNLPPAPVGSLVFEVSLFELSLIDGSVGDAIHQLPDPLTIWFTTTSPLGTRYAFGTLNESTGEWEQLAVIEKDKNGQLCGDTPHLSYFYLGPAPVPEPSTWVLVTIGASGLVAIRRWRK